MNLFSLKDKVALVTGGYGHLGKVITVALSEAGANVIVLGKAEDKFNDAFSSMGRNIFFQEFDISNTESIVRGYKDIAKKYDKIDVLVNNAVYVQGKASESINDIDWQYSIDGCLNSVHRCIREVIPYLKKNKISKIINVSSMYGTVAPDFNIYSGFEQYTNHPGYGAAKAGVNQLTKYFSSSLAQYNILVNTVSPGAFPGESVQKSTGFIENLARKSLLGRIGEPDDLKGVFVFLSSGASNFITGQNIIVDGGWTVI